MSTLCATAAPTHYPPGEAHSLPATAPLVTTFVAGPLPVNRASEVAARRLATHPIGTRRPLSSPPSLSATPQLHPAQPLWARVAQNASGDTRRHATARPAGVGSLLPLAAFHAQQASQWQKAPDPLNVSIIAKPSGDWPSLRKPVTRRPVAPPVVTHAASGDAPTPTRPTSSALCRPKRVRRHTRHATQFARLSSARHPRLQEGPSSNEQRASATPNY